MRLQKEGFFDQAAFNRTIVELKYIGKRGDVLPINSFNRTIVELKSNNSTNRVTVYVLF